MGRGDNRVLSIEILEKTQRNWHSGDWNLMDQLNDFSFLCKLEEVSLESTSL